MITLISTVDEDLIIGVLNALENEERCRQIRRLILDDEQKIKDEDYDVACQVFDETSIAYFILGFDACRSLLINKVA